MAHSLSSVLSKLTLTTRSACFACRSGVSVSREALGPGRAVNHIQTRNATHAAAGVANGPKNRPGRRLGAKRGNGEYVTPNTIIFRQRGSTWHAGENCSRARDHAIVAQQPGYVRYYRDPLRHPDRKYIGVVFKAEDQLPYPQNASRKRRLGLVAVPVGDAAEGPVEDASDVLARQSDAPAPSDQPLGAVARSGKSWPWQSYTDEIKVTGRDGQIRSFKMKSDYSYRMSNAEIGRAAETAGVSVQPYVRNRFLAWRKANARKTRNALARTAGKKKGKKAAKKS